MIRSAHSSHKKAQKESLLFQELSKLYLALTLDEPKLAGLFLTRVRIADDGSICTAFFYGDGGLAEFEEKRPILVLYKASLRQALSKLISGRYTPAIVFKYDDQFEKQLRMDRLMDSIKETKSE